MTIITFKHYTKDSMRSFLACFFFFLSLFLLFLAFVLFASLAECIHIANHTLTQQTTSFNIFHISFGLLFVGLRLNLRFHCCLHSYKQQYDRESETLAIKCVSRASEIAARGTRRKSFIGCC